MYPENYTLKYEEDLTQFPQKIHDPLKVSKKVSWPLNKFSFIFIAQHCRQKLLSKKWVHEHTVVLKAQQTMTKGHCEMQLGTHLGWGTAKPQLVHGKVVMVVQEAKPPEVLKILQFTILQKVQKPTKMVHFYPFLTIINARDHTKLGSGQNFSYFFILKNMSFSHTLNF